MEGGRGRGRRAQGIGPVEGQVRRHRKEATRCEGGKQVREWRWCWYRVTGRGTVGLGLRCTWTRLCEMVSAHIGEGQQDYVEESVKQQEVAVPTGPAKSQRT